MKVFITATPEYSPEEFDEVLHILNERKSHVTFVDGGIIDDRGMKLLFNHYHEKPNLSFQDIWKIIGDYRYINKIDDNAYVAMLTPKKNNLNWFSAFNGKDLFVDTNDWNLYTEKESKYGIAFSIIENLIQTLMNLNINDVQNEPNIHYEKSIGCINDFCGTKSDIMFKFRNVYICPSCQERIKKERIDIPTITHLIDLIESLRSRMVNNFQWLDNYVVDQVTVDEKGDLKIGDKAVNFGEQHKSIYYLFLNNEKGIVTTNLSDYQEALVKLYYNLRHNTDATVSNRAINTHKEVEKNVIKESTMKEIKNMFTPIIDRYTNRFTQEKSKVNGAIKKAVGLKLSEFYIIDNVTTEENKVYKLKLKKENITLDPKFKV